MFSHKNFLIIVSAPSGAGKSTLCHMLLDSDKRVSPTVSVTTRKKRPGEVYGKSYIFVNEKEFQEKVKKGEFLEHAKVFDNYYGTLKKTVNEKIQQGEDVLFDIDWQGARQIRKNFKKDDIISVFILPPSLKLLRERLYNRKQDSKEVIESRMDLAKKEISHYKEYDYVIVNKDLDKAARQLRAIVLTKRMERTSEKELKEFADNLLSEEN